MYLLTPMIPQGSVNFKFGVLYAKEGQLTDDEMFSNGEFFSGSVIRGYQLSIYPQQLVVNVCASVCILYHPNLNDGRRWHHLNVLNFQIVLMGGKLSNRCCACFRDGEREFRQVPQSPGWFRDAAGVGWLPRRSRHKESGSSALMSCIYISVTLN